ncbi:aquaporin-like [Bombyx mandarina]|uniref:Aquaporin AQP-Bom2 n=2 Tax=Bombyx TaxID=7090 RepID=Q14UC7_BOMMO|nr:aquaporin [Bombyx mori]XP_028030968.1 aquaporin-like [Bombyx mandarina]BAE97427.1 aquaporin AQP-Bom2 [Bombyx mori]
MTVSATNPQSVIEVIENKVRSDVSQASGCRAMYAWCYEWRQIVSEFISTLLLLVFGCMACIPHAGYLPQPPIYGALGFGLVVSFNVQIFGHISGAHMNPSVTLASLIWGAISFPLAIAFIVAQCAGAILGYGLLIAVSHIDMDGVCMTLPRTEITLFQALIVEAVLTAALSFLNCACWDPVNKNKQDSVPVKFGLAIAGLSIAGGPLTGASMNPARSLGPALWTGIWTGHWVYWVGPLVGSAIAAVFYLFVWLKKEDTP